MTEYDPSRFQPQTSWNAETHQWEDRNRRNRTVNNRKQIETAIGERKARNYGLSDIKIPAYPTIQGAGPEEFGSIEDHARTQAIAEMMQAIRQTSGGEPPEITALRIQKLNAALRSGELPIKTAVDITRLEQLIRMEGKHSISKYEQMERNLDQASTTAEKWRMNPQEIDQTRAQRLQAIEAAQPAIDALFTETAKNYSRILGKDVSPGELRSIVKSLSDEQLGAAISQMQAVIITAGPGAGKSTVLQMMAMKHIGEAKTPEEALEHAKSITVLSQTHSAVNNFMDKLSKFREMVPGWTEEQLRSQGKTLASWGMSQLTKGQTMGSEDNPVSILQTIAHKTGMRGLAPLYEGSQQGNTIEAELKRNEEKQKDILRLAFERHKIKGQGSNLAHFSQKIAEIKGKGREESVERLTSGERLYKAKAHEQKGTIPDDLALYLYQQALRNKKGFEVGLGSPRFDINDVPHMLLYAAEQGLLKPSGTYISDETQDNPPVYGQLFAAMGKINPKTRFFFGGDPSQMVIDRPWHFDRTTQEAFGSNRSSMHPLTGNYRSNDYTVAFLNAMNGLAIMADQPKSPMQISIAGPSTGNAPDVRVEQNQAQLHRSMFEDWMTHMQTSLPQLKEGMEAGNPFGETRFLPGDAPFQFTMQDQRKNFLAMLPEFLSQEMPPEMVKEFMEKHVTSETPSSENIMKIHALMMSQARGREFPAVFSDLTYGGLWNQVGLNKQMYTMASRVTSGDGGKNFFYGSLTNIGQSRHDLTPDFFAGQKVIGGFGTLLQGMTEDMVKRQGAHPSNLDSAYQMAYQSNPRIMYPEGKQEAAERRGPTANPEMIQAYIDQVSLLRTYHSPAVGMGSSGIQEAMSSGIGKNATEAFGDLGLDTPHMRRRGKMNAATASGQTRRGGQNRTLIEYASRLAESLVRNGPGQGRSGMRFIYGKNGEHEDVMSHPHHASVPSPREFLDQAKSSTQMLPYHLLEEIQREAPSEFSEFDNREQNFTKRDWHEGYQGRDDKRLRDWVRIALDFPGIAHSPEMMQRAAAYYTHPKVTKAIAGLAHKDAPQSKLARLQEMVRLAWLPEGLIHRKNERIKALQIIQDQAGKLPKALQGLNIGKGADVSKKKAPKGRALTKEEQQELALLQAEMAHIGPEAQNRIISLITAKHSADPQSDPKLFNQGIIQTIHHAAIKLLAESNLDPDFLKDLAMRAYQVHETLSNPKQKEMMQAIARTFLDESKQMRDDGISLTESSLAHIRRTDPAQAALLSRLFRDDYSGDLLPYDHPELKKRIAMIDYHRGVVERGQGAAIGMPIAHSRTAPARTQLRTLYRSLQGGFWEGNGNGALDRQAVQALLRPGGDPEKALDDDRDYPEYGVGAPLYAQRQRYTEMLNRGGMEKSHQAEIEHQLQMVNQVESGLGSEANQRDWGHTLNIAMKASTGEGVIDLRKGDDFDRDPIRGWFEHRENTIDDHRSLESLIGFMGALQQATQHIQKTGTLKRSHLDQVLGAFGYSPDDKKMSGLRMLEKEEQFKGEAELPLQKLIKHFPDDRKEMQEQLTRVPLLPEHPYTFRGGEEGFGGLTIEQERKGIPVGADIEGTLHPYNEKDKFGTAKTGWYHLGKGMFTEQELAAFNAQNEQEKKQQGKADHRSFFQFQGTHQGNPISFPVNPDQLSLVSAEDQAREATLFQGQEDARWQEVRQKERETNAYTPEEIMRLSNPRPRYALDPSPDLGNHGFYSYGQMRAIAPQPGNPLWIGQGGADMSEGYDWSQPEAPFTPTLHGDGWGAQSYSQSRLRFYHGLLHDQHQKGQIAQQLVGLTPQLGRQPLLPQYAASLQGTAREESGFSLVHEPLTHPDTIALASPQRLMLPSPRPTTHIDRMRGTMGMDLDTYQMDQLMQDAPTLERGSGQSLLGSTAPSVGQSYHPAPRATFSIPGRPQGGDIQQPSRLIEPATTSSLRPSQTVLPPQVSFPQSQPTHSQEPPIVRSQPPRTAQAAYDIVRERSTGHRTLDRPAGPRGSDLNYALWVHQKTQSFLPAHSSYISNPTKGQKRVLIPQHAASRVKAVRNMRSRAHRASRSRVRINGGRVADAIPLGSSGSPLLLPQHATRHYTPQSDTLLDVQRKNIAQNHQQKQMAQQLVGQVQHPSRKEALRQINARRQQSYASFNPSGGVISPIQMGETFTQPGMAVSWSPSGPAIAQKAHQYTLGEVPGLLREGGRRVAGVDLRHLSKEQRDALDSQEKHQIIQGGPGTGKTDVAVMRLLDQVAQGKINAPGIRSFSGLHSGVDEINKRYDELLRPMLPSGPAYQVPAAGTVHSLAHQIVFPHGEASPLLGELGWGHIQNVIANPSPEELTTMSHDEAAIKKDQQYKVLRTAIKSAYPAGTRGIPYTNMGLEAAIKDINTWKENRFGEDALYDKNMEIGLKHLDRGIYSHQGAFAAYEQELPRQQVGDYSDLITASRQMLETYGAAAVPPELADTQQIFYDEQQDAPPEQMAMLHAFRRATDSQMMVGLDPMQALFQDHAEKNIPALKKELGSEGIAHHELTVNYRGDKSNVALYNAVLGQSAKPLSLPQVANSSVQGDLPQFVLAKSEPELYKKTFRSMLENTGVPISHITDNIADGLHPFHGVDWTQQGLTKPGQIPIQFMTKAQRRLFEHVAPSAIEGIDPEKITPEMAKAAFHQMYRSGVPGKKAHDKDKEAFARGEQFSGIMVGQARSRAYDKPVAVVHRAGYWAKDTPEARESYLNNLGVQVSRVRAGGQQTLVAASRPFSAKQSDEYIRTNGANFEETRPDSLLEGIVRAGDRLIEGNVNTTHFEQWQGQTVPHGFPQIMSAATTQISDWQTQLNSPASPPLEARPQSPPTGTSHAGRPHANNHPQPAPDEAIPMPAHNPQPVPAQQQPSEQMAQPQPAPHPPKELSENDKLAAQFWGREGHKDPRRLKNAKDIFHIGLKYNRGYIEHPTNDPAALAAYRQHAEQQGYTVGEWQKATDAYSGEKIMRADVSRDQQAAASSASPRPRPDFANENLSNHPQAAAAAGKPRPLEDVAIPMPAHNPQPVPQPVPVSHIDLSHGGNSVTFSAPPDDEDEDPGPSFMERLAAQEPSPYRQPPVPGAEFAHPQPPVIPLPAHVPPLEPELATPPPEPVTPPKDPNFILISQGTGFVFGPSVFNEEVPKQGDWSKVRHDVIRGNTPRPQPPNFTLVKSSAPGVVPPSASRRRNQLMLSAPKSWEKVKGDIIRGNTPRPQPPNFTLVKPSAPDIIPLGTSGRSSQLMLPAPKSAYAVGEALPLHQGEAMEKGFGYRSQQTANGHPSDFFSPFAHEDLPKAPHSPTVIEGSLEIDHSIGAASYWQRLQERDPSGQEERTVREGFQQGLASANGFISVPMSKHGLGPENREHMSAYAHFVQRQGYSVGEWAAGKNGNSPSMAAPITRISSIPSEAQPLNIDKNTPVPLRTSPQDESIHLGTNGSVKIEGTTINIDTKQTGGPGPSHTGPSAVPPPPGASKSQPPPSSGQQAQDNHARAQSGPPPGSPPPGDRKDIPVHDGDALPPGVGFDKKGIFHEFPDSEDSGAGGGLSRGAGRGGAIGSVRPPGGGDKDYATPFFGGMQQLGRTVARVSSETQYVGKLFADITDSAASQGSQYRHATTGMKGAGATADQGFFDFSNSQSGISQMSANLPMYSTVQNAQMLRNVSAQTGGFGINVGTATTYQQLGAVTGMDPTQLMQQGAYYTGATGQGMSTKGTNNLVASMAGLYGGNLTADNVAPTMQAINGVMPSMQGNALGQGNQLQSLMTLFAGAMAGGATAQNLPDMAGTIGNLTQIGMNPDLRQQYTMNKMFPGQLTADTQLTQFNQQQLGQSEQIEQLSLQKAVDLPGLQIKINNADIAMQSANFDLAQMQQNYNQASYANAQLNQQYSEASFQEKQYIQNQELGPIGADTGRNSYFDFMRNQQNAGYNPLSAEAGTQFKASAPQGLQNMQFYAGVEHQRQDMILSRSPLLSDAKFQEDMKYLNQQEAFYKAQLDLTNQQRKFEVDWTTKLLASQGHLLDMQGPMLAQQKKILGIQGQQLELNKAMTDYQNQSLTIQQKYLPQQLDALLAIQKATQEFMNGDGPVNGKNVTPEDIIKQLASVKDDKAMRQEVQAMGLSPADTKNVIQMVEGIKKTPGGWDALQKSTAPQDKALKKNIDDFKKSGAFTDEKSQASVQNAYLQFAGTGGGWDQFVTKFDDADAQWQSIAQSLSDLAPTMKGLATFMSIAGPVMMGAALILNTVGTAGSLASKLPGGGSGALNPITGAAYVIGGEAVLSSQIPDINPGGGIGDGKGQNSWQTILGHALVDSTIGGAGYQTYHQGSQLLNQIPGAWNNLTGWFSGGSNKTTGGGSATRGGADAGSGGLELPHGAIDHLSGPHKGGPKATPQADLGPAMLKMLTDGWDAFWSEKGPAGHFFKKTLPIWLGDVIKGLKTNLSGFLQWLKFEAGVVWNNISKWFIDNIWTPFEGFTKAILNIPVQIGNAINSITNFFSPTGKNTLWTLISGALKNINWGNMFNLGGGGGASGGGGSEPANHQGFTAPTVNTDFGAKVWYGTGKHQGVDFKASQGTQLREMVGGQVINTGFYDWGGEVDVKIPGGLTERYLHLSSIGVKKGDTVGRGQYVGLTGGGTKQSGLGYWSTGAHSHVQYDTGGYSKGVNPWSVWRKFADMNLANFYGPTGKPEGAAGGGGGGAGIPIPHLATGGIAMTPMMASIAEREPEMVVPLSKLSETLKSLHQSNQGTVVTQSNSSQQSSKQCVEVKNLIGNATFNISTGGSKMSDHEKDELMSQIFEVFAEAIKQLNGKL